MCRGNSSRLIFCLSVGWFVPRRLRYLHPTQLSCIRSRCSVFALLLEFHRYAHPRLPSSPTIMAWTARVVFFMPVGLCSVEAPATAHSEQTWLWKNILFSNVEFLCICAVCFFYRSGGMAWWQSLILYIRHTTIMGGISVPIFGISPTKWYDISMIHEECTCAIVSVVAWLVGHRDYQEIVLKRLQPESNLCKHVCVYIVSLWSILW